MASKIRVLTEDTINKIAAGEVIENPASVVKELVENSLDAGATEICVDIRGGGRQLIRVTDNGCGMSRDDALLCLERHATSKLRQIDDLSAILTMGFRGEALPSIASISKFTMLTRYQEKGQAQELGTMVIVDGGKLLDCSNVACAGGTTIEVKSLFFNVPVRKKFQRSPASDVCEIQKMLTLLALGHPHVKFQLISNQETLLHAILHPQEAFLTALSERIKNVLGIEYFVGLLPIEARGEGFSLKGYIGLPECSRHNRSGQFLFINRRGVQSPLVSFAIRDGYGTMLATRRHPIYVVHLEVEGDLLDVNVHPQKREVRLRQELALKELTIKAVEKALQQQSREALFCLKADAKAPLDRELRDQEPIFSALDLNKNTASSWPNPDARVKEPLYSKESYPIFMDIPQEDRQSSFTVKELSLQLQCQANPQPEIKLQTELFPLQEQAKPMTFKALGALKKYIIAVKEENSAPLSPLFYLVDQRLAHARIIYEKLIKGPLDARYTQTLLIPHTLNLPPIESIALKEQLPALQGMGVHIKEFGAHTFVVDALPSFFGNVDLNQLVHELIASLQESKGSEFLAKEHKKKVAIAASRSAISSERRLTLTEAQSLLDQLSACDLPLQCPSGKKTMIFWTAQEVASLF